MAWETRGNNSYYYRKKRAGGKVVSEYVGRGFEVEGIISMELAERLKRNNEAEAIRSERDELESLDRQAIESISFARRMVESFLIVSGFHKHRGQWRKTRNGRR